MSKIVEEIDIAVEGLFSKLFKRKGPRISRRAKRDLKDATERAEDIEMYNKTIENLKDGPTIPHIVLSNKFTPLKKHIANISKIGGIPADPLIHDEIKGMQFIAQIAIKKLPYNPFNVKNGILQFWAGDEWYTDGLIIYIPEGKIKLYSDYDVSALSEWGAVELYCGEYGVELDMESVESILKREHIMAKMKSLYPDISEDRISWNVTRNQKLCYNTHLFGDYYSPDDKVFEDNDILIFQLSSEEDIAEVGNNGVIHWMMDKSQLRKIKPGIVIHKHNAEAW